MKFLAARLGESGKFNLTNSLEESMKNIFNIIRNKPESYFQLSLCGCVQLIFTRLKPSWSRNKTP